MIEIEYKTEFESTKDSPHLTLIEKQWCVFCDDFGENWRYNSTAQYVCNIANNTAQKQDTEQGPDSI